MYNVVIRPIIIVTRRIFLRNTSRVLRNRMRIAFFFFVLSYLFLGDIGRYRFRLHAVSERAGPLADRREKVRFE